MGDLNNLFGDNLRRIRESKGWSRERLAEICKPKISAQSIANYETGRRWPEKPYIEVIAKALKVKSSAFFKDKNDDKINGEISISDAAEILSKIASTSPERRAATLAVLYGDISLLDQVDLSKVTDLFQPLLKSK